MYHRTMELDLSDLKKNAARYRQESSAHCPGGGRREATSHCMEGSKGYSRSQTGPKSAVSCGFDKEQTLSRTMLNKSRGCKKCEVTLPFYSMSTGVL